MVPTRKKIFRADLETLICTVASVYTHRFRVSHLSTTCFVTMLRQILQALGVYSYRQQNSGTEHEKLPETFYISANACLIGARTTKLDTYSFKERTWMASSYVFIL